MTSIPDILNGTFELGGGILCWLNVQRLWKDRQIQGVDWRVSAFFSAWGFWNLFYYPSLHQWASFAGGVLLVMANTIWVVLALRYRSAPILDNLPEIKHTYKCECDLRKDQ